LGANEITFALIPPFVSIAQPKMWRKASRLVRETTSWKTRRQGQAEAPSAAVATIKPSTRTSTPIAHGLPIIITWSQLAIVAAVAVLLQCHVCQGE